MLSYLNQLSNDGLVRSPEWFFYDYASRHEASDFSYSADRQLLGVNTSTSIILDSMRSGHISGYSISGSELQTTLATGHKVAAMMPNAGPNGEGHAIVINGYNGSGMYEIYNPTTNETYSVSGGDLGGTNFLIAIN